ncbi:sialoadhesin-like [Sander lucioperca]|uniref:sialoadhesin-like n=1 Tax=Sander lucioperca TaxID=283035 RepID=UPI0016537234|nr:sialoadhesin-like [Sander lucioperca]
MKIRSSRDDGEFKRGEAVTLNCSAAICTIHQLEVTWFRDGHALSETGPALHLNNLTAKDCGNYTCGLKKNNRTLSVPYSLHVEDQMKIRSSRDDGEFKRGEAVTLNCTTSCTIHQLEVTWFRDGHALSETGPTLHLSYLTAKNSGNYTCGLKKNNRTLSVPYSLHVEADEEGGGLPLIVGLVVGVLLFLFAVILVVCIIKRKRAAGLDQTAVGRDGEQEHSDNIYSNDFLPLAEQQGPSRAVEEVSYASVQFTHKKQARPVEEVEDSIIYSSVARTG